MKPIDNYQKSDCIGKHFRIVIDTDIIESTDHYTNELVDFNHSIQALDCKKTAFKYVINHNCDSYRLQLRDEARFSLQSGLEAIHQYPKTYQAKNQGNITADFSKFLKGEPFVRCGVGLGTVGDDENDPLNDPGAVYLRSCAAMKKFDRVRKREKIKAFVITLFSTNLDFILNNAETVICASKDKHEWSDFRNDLIKLWDNLLLDIREELEDVDRWIKNEQNERAFYYSNNILEQVESLKNSCLQYWKIENPATYAVLDVRLNAMYNLFVNARPPMPDREAS